MLVANMRRVDGEQGDRARTSVRQRARPVPSHDKEPIDFVRAARSGGQDVRAPLSRNQAAAMSASSISKLA